MLTERLLKYVSFDTTSSEISGTTPSTACQLELAKCLLSEIKEIGLSDCVMDEFGYVYGYLDGDSNMPTIGLLAHMDTSPSASGKNVKPRIILDYDGKDIKLNDIVTTTVERFPFLKEYEHKTLMVTDGNTLLGADDKAGIAVIMEVIETFVNNSQLKHGPIRVCFTPDEEIGEGTDHFNYDIFKVDFAYTIDGDKPNNVEYENFNAASASITFNGISVHPGSAKDKMVNALMLACEFNSYLDPMMVPEHTEGYEGFNHLVHMNGEVEKANSAYILRNHNYDLLCKQKKDFEDIAKKMNDKYGYKAVDLVLENGYRNMREKFEGNMYPIDLVHEAMDNLGMDFTSVPIRGGTDGANLTWNGILCPNLGAGGQNFHGVHEFWCKEEGEQAVELLLELLQIAKNEI